MRVRCTSLLLVLTTVLAGQAADGQTETGRRVLDYCLARPDRCALSVQHLTGGWERHWNGDRLVPSGVSDLMLLLSYTDAVQTGKLDPATRVSREQWVETWIGAERGALHRAFTRLGSPDDVSFDDLALVMIADGDRAARDFLLERLGTAGVRRGRELWPGYHDPVVSYAGSRALWLGTPAEAGSARRLLRERSGIGALAYRQEIAAMAGELKQRKTAAAVRTFLCEGLPWLEVEEPCVSSSLTSPAQTHNLARFYGPESTTRTCARVMADLLRGSGRVAALASRVNDRLETDFRSSTLLQGTFARLGFVGRDIVPGSLVQDRVAFVAFFLKAASGGAEVAGCASISETSGEEIGNLFEFAEAVLLDSVFAAELQARLPVVAETADLAPRVTKLKHRVRRPGDKLVVTVDVVNAGAIAAAPGIRVELWVSDDDELGSDDTLIDTTDLRAIAAGGTSRGRLRGKRLAPLAGSYLIVRVDATGRVDEADERNNVVFERLGPNTGP